MDNHNLAIFILNFFLILAEFDGDGATAAGAGAAPRVDNSAPSSARGAPRPTPNIPKLKR
jgi:hypothetical protein